MSESRINLILGIVFTLLGAVMVYLFMRNTFFSEDISTDDGIVLSYVLIFVSFLFLSMGGFLISLYNRKERARMWLRKNGLRKTGNIIEIKESWRTWGRFLLDEIVVMADDGEQYLSEGLSRKQVRKKYQVGDSVEILYHPNDPYIYDVQVDLK